MFMRPAPSGSALARVGDRRSTPATIRKYAIANDDEVGTSPGEWIYFVERGGKPHAPDLEQLGPPGDPFHDRVERRSMAARLRLAAHDVIGAGFPREHGGVPGGESAAPGNPCRV